MTFDQIHQRVQQLRSIPLEAVLLQAGAQRDRLDKAKWHTAQGTISITGMRFMNWNQGAGGGGAIDLAMHLNGIAFKAAVEWLATHFTVPDYSESVLTSRRLDLPPPDPRRLPAIRDYLIQERAISPPLIQSLIASGKLYADTRSNAVFLLLGKENRPVGAELRGAGPTRWRGMAPGSRKDLGYFAVPALRPTAAVLCESAIDAISCSLLYPGYLCISSSGTRHNSRWLPTLLSQDHPAYCGFDADPAGDEAAQRMIALYAAIRRLRPPQHDWNDVLKSHSTASLPPA